MEKLTKYNNTTVRVVCRNGEAFTGACAYFPPEYGLCEFGVEEESLQIGDDMLFESDIREIEVLRGEACLPVRDWPEAKEEIAAWFRDRWPDAPEAFRESIIDCLGTETGIPQWYVVVRGSRIVAGCGVVGKPCQGRKEPTPHVCAVYVDKEFRNRGIAGFLLQTVCDDMAAMGVGTLYLLTELSGFFERYGWQFLGPVRGDDGKLSRLYAHHTQPGL